MIALKFLNHKKKLTEINLIFFYVHINFNLQKLINSSFYLFSHINMRCLSDNHINRKCYNNQIQFQTQTVYFRQQELLHTHKSEFNYQKSINLKEIF